MKVKTNTPFYAFIAVVILLIVSLQYNFWFSDTGYLKLKSLRVKVVQEKQEVNNKQLNNEKLYSEVVSLRDNNSVLENLARENLGYIKKGEVFYSVE
ncbi:septum formation initiator family protein [Pseudofrancisella aestuarii]|uniref:Cell division protein FtsB n=1 Tax=Pseudofrancisella aestuarii TaxID=2670347 RepID=A0ABV9T9Q1_9GAMM|nr:septum formation initiator family protein [Pseudofrancisella aestuarii]